MSINDSIGSSKDSSNKQSLSDKYKKWDQIAKEADEDPECDNRDELDKFFKTIYKDLDDDGRKAMMKSFTESGGTVLSTNWKDVGQKKVDVKPPEGMEHKQYDK
ncbi:hypothetical protein M3Y97_00406100 [Aphelenchoides bicaudatus]|nr:hypothetical protein M3Y97_00406100 [Aphelenchoides bicaudatus]